MGSMRNNIVDVTRTDVGIARRLKWDPNERDLALYSSPHADYTKPIEICPIVDGQVHITKMEALNVKDHRPSRPIGVLSGSALRRLAEINNDNIEWP
ncbi:g6204 [Coccomyxa viridis]|uniref:G6204 protein n=1 Tax=Coccomyxa viridis TaxID=1274662 RepID=A0ABP1FUU5_9CHLO